MRLSTFQRVQSLISNKEVSQYLNITGFSSEIGTKLRDWAVGQAGGSCYSRAALSSNDSKIECDRKGRWSLCRTAFNEIYGITAEEPKHFGKVSVALYSKTR